MKKRGVNENSEIQTKIKTGIEDGLMDLLEKAIERTGNKTIIKNSSVGSFGDNQSDVGNTVSGRDNNGHGDEKKGIWERIRSWTGWMWALGGFIVALLAWYGINPSTKSPISEKPIIQAEAIKPTVENPAETILDTTKSDSMSNRKMGTETDTTAKP